MQSLRKVFGSFSYGQKCNLIKRQACRNVIGSSHLYTKSSNSCQTQICMLRSLCSGTYKTGSLPAGQYCSGSSSLLATKHSKINSQQNFHEDRETKDVTVWGSIKHIRHTPMPALILGVSGLVPFMAAPAYMVYSSVYMADICFAQMAYGATILSFLGGVRWGYSVAEGSVLRPDWINLGVSVLPSLVAWGGLLIPYPGSLFTVMGGLAGVGYYDMVTYGYPPWFKGLRFILTFVAVLSLWSTFMCKFLLKESNSIKTEQNTEQ